ncbi:hypothetical protein ANN_06394 [Periplaneta americana]|uniref:Uncharacterized protein n=1 Tax=Periplaneta americana TaxID=6978 RepID=A0ABQ8TDE7_PERAM|nr:hypothetical protein ANN_06394 [Periplaneta americana]
MADLCEGGNEPPGSLKAIRQEIYFMQDGASAHFSLNVREHLDERYPLSLGRLLRLTLPLLLLLLYYYYNAYYYYYYYYYYYDYDYY